MDCWESLRLLSVSQKRSAYAIKLSRHQRVTNSSGKPQHYARGGDPGPGSHGPPSKGASSRSLSDPHAPHRLQAELETLSQFSQKTARSSGIEIRPCSFLIICTLHMTTSESARGRHPCHPLCCGYAAVRAANSSSSMSGSACSQQLSQRSLVRKVDFSYE